MAQMGFFQYLRLKFQASVLRFLARFKIRASLARDKALADRTEVEVERVRIASREQGHFINADLYYPPGKKHSSPATSKVPILVNWHGSGFVLDMFGSDSLLCTQIARNVGIFVLDCDYRKAPEYPFPGALEDVEDSLRWVSSQSLRFDTSRVAVSGFSAGANLALVAASALKPTLADINISISAVVAIYPVTDISIAPEDKSVPNPIQPLPSRIGHLFNDCYVPDKSMRTDPRVSPGLADPKMFPQAVVMITCEGDTLGPEARALAGKLKDGKRRVMELEVKEVHHGFDKGCEEGTKKWKAREEAYSLVVKTLKEVMNT